MLKKILYIIIILTIFPTGVFAATKVTKKTTSKTTTSKSVKLEHLIYYKPGEGSFAMLQTYGKQVGIFAPQVYTVDASGKLTGKISDVARGELDKNKTKIMPLVVNKDFSRDTMHDILDSTAVQDTVINALITEAKSKGYIGWQYDFEAINVEYRDQYSSFIERAAKAFKREKLLLSVAVIARTSENPADLPEGSWDYYAGVYDYKRIGAAADFVSLMSYDDPHSTGPVASIQWFKQVVTYAKKMIPAKKLSIGIPVYGWIWDTTTGKRVKTTTYDKYLELTVNNLYKEKGFDKEAGTTWITYTDEKTGKLYKLWYEDATSFKLKYDFVKAQKLRGVSIWSMGQEDEAIWKIIK
jgi:spore germination protein YaaH